MHRDGVVDLGRHPGGGAVGHDDDVLRLGRARAIDQRRGPYHIGQGRRVAGGHGIAGSQFVGKDAQLDASTDLKMEA